jgi:hypothetical protein
MQFLIQCFILIKIIVSLGSTPDIFAGEQNIGHKRSREEIKEGTYLAGSQCENREQDSFYHPSSFNPYQTGEPYYDIYAVKKIIRHIKSVVEEDYNPDDGIKWWVLFACTREGLYFEENFPCKWVIMKNENVKFDEKCCKIIDQIKIAFSPFQKEEEERKSSLDNRSMKLLTKKYYSKLLEQNKTIKECLSEEGSHVLFNVLFLDYFMISFLQNKIWILNLEDLLRINDIYSSFETTIELPSSRKKAFKEIKEKIFQHLKSLVERKNWDTLSSKDFNILQLYQYFFPFDTNAPPSADNIFIIKIRELFDKKPEKFSIEDMVCFYLGQFPGQEKIFEVINKKLQVIPEEELYKAVWVLFGSSMWRGHIRHGNFKKEFANFLESFPHLVALAITKKFSDTIKEKMPCKAYKKLGKDKTLLKLIDSMEKTSQENNFSNEKKVIFKKMVFSGLKDIEKVNQVSTLLQSRESIPLEKIEEVFNNKPVIKELIPAPAQEKHGKDHSIFVKFQERKSRTKMPFHKNFSSKAQQSPISSPVLFDSPAYGQSYGNFFPETQESTPQNFNELLLCSDSEVQQSVILTFIPPLSPFSFDFCQDIPQPSSPFFIDFPLEFPSESVPNF